MTDSRDRMERIGLLSRQEKGRTQIPQYLHDLGQALGKLVGTDSLLDLGLTDEATRVFAQRYQSAIKSPSGAFIRRFPMGSEVSAYALLTCMAGILADVDVVLLTKFSEFCGAVLVKQRSALLSARQLLALDGDSLLLMSQDGENGMVLDYTADEPDRAYELTVFGSNWVTAVSTCEQTQ